MKMDVSYTDHSHIIGRGGLSIRRVMDETKCHVHFPDSNRSNLLEKSNQVSVSGDIDGVECARSRVRELIPLIFGFELPVMTQNFDIKSEYIQKIEEDYNIQVMMKTRPKLHATLVLVKGAEWEVNQVKQATLLLMKYMCDKLANQTPVQMSMEISPHHHSIILGKNHCNLKAIMQFTTCQILFPDAQDPNIPNLKKSNVNITGNINNVYKARQLLMGSLPLIIIFDLPEDINVTTELINNLQATFDVQINVRQKANKLTKACIIKGIEKYADNIYKARSHLLGLTECTTKADIPDSYCMPENVSCHASNMLPPNSPMWSSVISPTWPYQSPTQKRCSVTTSNNQTDFHYNIMQRQSSHHVQTSLGSSGYQSLSTSNQSVEVKLNCELTEGVNVGISSSPRRPLSPIHYRDYTEVSFGNYISGPDSPLKTNNSQKPSEDSHMQYKKYDYDCKRLSGLRAMQQRPNPNRYRIPTACWSGYGISQTSPAVIISKHRNDENVWKSPAKSYEVFPESHSMLNSSNFLDQTSTCIRNRISPCSHIRDLPTMLSALGLDRYTSLFAQHEIDLTTFATLTDKDLVEIGITAFGARRKILLAICDMNNKNIQFSAAPGAERKSSSSSNSTSSPKW